MKTINKLRQFDQRIGETRTYQALDMWLNRLLVILCVILIVGEICANL